MPKGQKAVLNRINEVPRSSQIALRPRMTVEKKVNTQRVKYLEQGDRFGLATAREGTRQLRTIGAVMPEVKVKEKYQLPDLGKTV